MAYHPPLHLTTLVLITDQIINIPLALEIKDRWRVQRSSSFDSEGLQLIPPGYVLDTLGLRRGQELYYEWRSNEQGNWEGRLILVTERALDGAPMPDTLDRLVPVLPHPVFSYNLAGSATCICLVTYTHLNLCRELGLPSL